MAPITILIVDKSGVIKETPIKTFVESELYKKAGFKTADDFKCRTQWNIEDLHGKSFYISVFGKITGRANQENKYDFPPPIDSTLMFGSCIIINKNKTGETVSISEDEWDTVYDHLFGGFEDIGDKDSEDEDSEDDEDDLPLTKDGYVKDDFIVDEEEEDEEDEEDEEEEEEEDDEEKVKPQIKKSKIKIATAAALKSSSSKKKKSNDIENIFTRVAESQENYLDCTSELCEEPYLE